MTKAEFKKRWGSYDPTNGITFEEIAECYVAWGLGTRPKTKGLNEVTYSVLKAANTDDAEAWNPELDNAE